MTQQSILRSLHFSKIKVADCNQLRNVSNQAIPILEHYTKFENPVILWMEYR